MLSVDGSKSMMEYVTRDAKMTTIVVTMDTIASNQMKYT